MEDRDRTGSGFRERDLDAEEAAWFRFGGKFERDLVEVGRDRGAGRAQEEWRGIQPGPAEGVAVFHRVGQPPGGGIVAGEVAEGEIVSGNAFQHGQHRDGGAEGIL